MLKKSFIQNCKSIIDNKTFSERGHHLIVVGQVACLSDPKSYVGWSLVLLVGPPMPKRSKGRDQTKSDALAPGPPGWGTGCE